MENKELFDKRCKDFVRGKIKEELKEDPTLEAYVLCFIHLKLMESSLKELREKGINVADDDLENWFTENHYQKWSKVHGNDWRGLLKFLKKKQQMVIL